MTPLASCYLLFVSVLGIHVHGTRVFFMVTLCLYRIVVDWVSPPSVRSFDHLFQRCGRKTIPVLDGIAGCACVCVHTGFGWCHQVRGM